MKRFAVLTGIVLVTLVSSTVGAVPASAATVDGTCVASVTLDFAPPDTQPPPNRSESGLPRAGNGASTRCALTVIQPREKGGTQRWPPVFPTLATALASHARTLGVTHPQPSPTRRVWPRSTRFAALGVRYEAAVVIAAIKGWL